MPFDRWEYRTLHLPLGGWIRPKVDLETLQQTLDEQGREGWELVSTTDVTSQERTTGLLLVFKRPGR